MRRDNAQYCRVKRAATKIAGVKFTHPEGKMECALCGENRLQLLQFHHKDPGQKEYTLSPVMQQRSWDYFVDELVKCIPICATCHLLEHTEKLTSKLMKEACKKAETIIEKQRKRYSHKRMVELYEEGLTYVEIAGKMGASFAIVTKVLTDKGFVCQREKRKQDLLPEIVELDRQDKNLSEISRSLGVSDLAVSKWLKEHYGTEKFVHFKERRRIELMPKIKEMRAQGLSQQAIADKVGLSQSIVGRWLKL